LGDGWNEFFEGELWIGFECGYLGMDGDVGVDVDGDATMGDEV